MSLRGEIVKLAHAQPELRKHLLPMLHEGASSKDLLKNINKSRETIRPPAEPMTEAQLKPVLDAAGALEKALRKAFKSDMRLTVMGNGVKVHDA